MNAPKKRKRRWLWIALLIFFGLLGAAVVLRPAPPIEVDSVRVSRGVVRELIASAASGEVKPARRVTVRAELGGTVLEVLKRRGERVAAGEVLVRFDAKELEARLEQAVANLQTASVALETARTRLATAERALARASKLSSGGAISPADLDRAETEVAASRLAVDQAVAARKTADAAVKLGRITASRAVVSAPYAGVLQEMFAEVGVQVGPASPLFDLIDDSSIYVDVPIDEADAARVRVGQTVFLQVDAARNETITGTVRFIPPAVGRSSASPVLDPAQIAKRDRFLYVEVTPAPETTLRVGASVNAEFLISSKDDVLYVPTHVVVGRGVERSVYLVQNGRAVLRKFRPGLTSWERTEVVEGLELGTELVSSLNAKGLSDGARIAVRSAAPGAPGNAVLPASAKTP